MMKYHEGKGQMFYYHPKRRSVVAKSTMATGQLLAVVHEQFPRATIKQLHHLLTGGMFIANKEAIAVLESFITKGFGDYVPADWD